MGLETAQAFWASVRLKYCHASANRTRGNQNHFHSACAKCGKSLDQLRDAQLHPERHRNLIVRVCGFSAYFTSLDEHVQDEIIARAFASL